MVVFGIQAKIFCILPKEDIIIDLTPPISLEELYDISDSEMNTNIIKMILSL